MPLTEVLRLRIVQLFCLFFSFVLLFKFFNYGFLAQQEPAFFYNRLDFSTWMVQLTGLHLLLLNNKGLCLAVDIIYVILPFLYLITFLENKKLSIFTAVLLFIFNFVYSILSCMYSLNALEQLTPYILFPIVFMSFSLSTFWFLFQGLRYFFLYFFASAGIWKFVQGGVFNLQQMSGIMIVQHKELLISNAHSLQVDFYRWLFENQTIGYALYLTAVVLELCFIVGFITKKFDKWLIILYLLFLFMNAIVMRIHYWETLPFLITLIYSRYTLPFVSKSKNAVQPTIFSKKIK